MNPSEIETIEIYGQYDILEYLGPPSFSPGRGFTYKLLAGHRKGQRRLRTLIVKGGIEAALGNPRLEGKTGGALNTHIKHESVACLHGLLDLGLFEESDEYTWVFTRKEEVFRPPLALDTPDFDGDLHQKISYHLLKALHRARQELPREYNKTKRLDPEGVYLILEITKDDFDYVAGRLKESGQVDIHGDFYDGEFHITEVGIEALRAMEQSRKTKRPTPRATQEVQSAKKFFSTIRNEIEKSSIEQDFKKVALCDLEEAQIAYGAGAFKACVVMLGAVLEGLILGTLRRPDVLDLIRNDSEMSGNIARSLGGIKKPVYSDDETLADALAARLSFEDYRVLICRYVPDIEQLRVEGIQNFRNAIHPWRAVQAFSIYGDYNEARAISHLTALVLLTENLLSWTPKV